MKNESKLPVPKQHLLFQLWFILKAFKKVYLCKKG